MCRGKRVAAGGGARWFEEPSPAHHGAPLLLASAGRYTILPSGRLAPCQNQPWSHHTSPGAAMLAPPPSRLLGCPAKSLPVFGPVAVPSRQFWGVGAGAWEFGTVAGMAYLGNCPVARWWHHHWVHGRFSRRPICRSTVGNAHQNKHRPPEEFNVVRAGGVWWGMLV